MFISTLWLENNSHLLRLAARLGFCRQKPVSATPGLNWLKPAKIWFKPIDAESAHYTNFCSISRLTGETRTKL